MIFYIHVSKENEDRPWVIVSGDVLYYFKNINIQVPSQTFTRENVAPPFVIKCEGKLFVSGDSATIEKE